MNKYEYIWLDGFEPEPTLRSKVKVTDGEPPEWSFDGSSTQQAEGGSSDCLLLPVEQYENPTNDGSLVMCQVHTGEHKVHPSNTRAAAEAVVTDEWWFGFEQEYFFTDNKGNPFQSTENIDIEQYDTLLIISSNRNEESITRFFQGKDNG